MIMTTIAARLMINTANGHACEDIPDATAKKCIRVVAFDFGFARKCDRKSKSGQGLS